MGCGPSFEKVPFDYPKPAPPMSGFEPLYISGSHLYCLAQHVAEWPQYYCLVDCRPKKQFDKSHIVGAEHCDDVTTDRCSEVTVIIYDTNEIAPGIRNFLDKITGSGPTAVMIYEGQFTNFKKKYKVIMSNFTLTQGEQPGPLELLPATKSNPALYSIHRNQFQHCKTTIAYLGCSTVINISSRRLFLKTAAIRLENIQFDNVNEPYDEAIGIFMKYLGEKPKSNNKGNILVIDENGCDYAALLVGWYCYKKGFDLEQVCEQLVNKMGEVDPWYLDVLRAWTESE